MVSTACRHPPAVTQKAQWQGRESTGILLVTVVFATRIPSAFSRLGCPPGLLGTPLVWFFHPPQLSV